MPVASLPSKDTQNAIVGIIGIDKLEIGPADPGHTLPVYSLRLRGTPSQVHPLPRRQVQTPEQVLGEEGLALHVLPSHPVFRVEGVAEADAQGLEDAGAVGAGHGRGGLWIGTGDEGHVGAAEGEGGDGCDESGLAVFVAGAIVVGDVGVVLGASLAGEDEALTRRTWLLLLVSQLLVSLLLVGLLLVGLMSVSHVGRMHSKALTL